MKLKTLFLFTSITLAWTTSYAQLLVVNGKVKTTSQRHFAKLVLQNNTLDTITTNIVVKYNQFDPSHMIVEETFKKGKVECIENNQIVIRKVNEISYLGFTDSTDKLRTYAFIPELKEKNIAEVKVSGKLNYYLIYTNKDNFATHGTVFIEKEGVIIKHKKYINRKYFKKIQKIISDEPDLARKFDATEIAQAEIFEILKEYNERKK